MEEWNLRLNHDPIAALLTGEDPAIAYFVRRDLLDQSVPEIASVWEMPASQRILRRQRSNGSWAGPKRKKATYPENHTDLLETFKQVRLLVERYEFSSKSEALAQAAEYLYSFQSHEGDLRGFIANQYATYYTGYVLGLLIRAGYESDPRTLAGLEWLLTMRQDDGGWTIPILTHRLDRDTGYRLTSSFQEPVQPDRTQPFSHNWTDMVLRAFAAHPQYRRHENVLTAARLLKSSFFQPDAYTSYQSPRYWTRFAFWWPNLLTAMESLVLLGFSAQDLDMAGGIEWFVENQAGDGLWRISNDGTTDRPTPVNESRRAWFSLRICRLLRQLAGGASDP
ncbi:MAG: hypothetical protein QNJ77_01315 [Acidimicrobiia bacterium]|nr:hypothetical protein [Acidimicrobiia bacterium]